ncbi:MAG: shikimate kinase [Gemmatimonadota bacterium]
MVLLGFMTSGKTQVGRALASQLGWTHVDLDREIERATGETIARIFADQGEPEFRRLEVQSTPRLLAAEHIVLSPGGGWITNQGLFESLPPDTLTVWLKVSPDIVARRLRRSRSRTVRPLLQEPDATRIAELLAERIPLYEKAAFHIDTDRLPVSRIAAEIAQIVRPGRPRSITPDT